MICSLVGYVRSYNDPIKNNFHCEVMSSDLIIRIDKVNLKILLKHI